MAVGIESVLASQVIRNAAVAVRIERPGNEALPNRELLLGNSWRNAGNGFLGEAGRASACSVADRPVRSVSVGIAMAIAGLSQCRGGKGECRGAREQKQLF